MTGLVTIKEIERIHIYMNETVIEVVPLVVYATIIILSIITGIAFYNIQITPNIQYSLWVPVFIFSGTLTLLQCALRVGTVFKPGYKLSISGHQTSDASITIEKTTPDADQIAICKAAQLLELKVMEIIKKQHQLELIASKCK